MSHPFVVPIIFLKPLDKLILACYTFIKNLNFFYGLFSNFAKRL